MEGAPNINVEDLVNIYWESNWTGPGGSGGVGNIIIRDGISGDAGGTGGVTVLSIDYPLSQTPAAVPISSVR